MDGAAATAALGRLGCHSLSVKPARTIVVSRADGGLRLDVLLARELGLSRGYVRRLLARGLARIEGGMVVKGTLLRAGDRIEIGAFHHPDEGARIAAGLEVRVLAEGWGYIAIDKPAGLPTHPLDFEETHTALNAVAAIRPEILDVGPAGLQAGVIHRLDTHTSGVLAFATEPRAWQRARAAFSTRRVEKRYVARVHGRLAVTVETRLALEQRGDHVAVVDAGGREAICRIEPLEAGSESSLVEVRPVTGMRHQIRVTLAHLGHPIQGDRLYGSTLELGRHLLHATYLRIGRFQASSEPPDALRGAEK
jgi:23S rRNA pseudouridine1911/1915/1917 synthase